MSPFKVPAAQVQLDFDRYQELALTRPVTITRDGQEQTVLVSAREYARLKSYDRKVMGLADFSKDDLEALQSARPPGEAAAYDHEFKP